MRIFSAALIFCAVAVPSQGGRPLATEDAYNVGGRSLELEFGLEYADEAEECRQYGHGLVATYGLADAVDAALEVPVLLSRTEEGEKSFGIGDVAARVKLGLIEAGPVTLAAVPQIKFATGDESRELGSGSNDVAALAAASLALGAATIHGNFGYNHAFPADGEDEGCAFAALAAEVHPVARFAVVAEGLADLARDDEAGRYPAYVGGGLSFAALENFALDAGVTFGLAAADGETAVTAGATWAVF
jgi:hypothetical protein